MLESDFNILLDRKFDASIQRQFWMIALEINVLAQVVKYINKFYPKFQSFEFRRNKDTTDSIYKCNASTYQRKYAERCTIALY